MKSDTPKVLHKVCGLPILTHIIKATRRAGAEKIVVVGKDAEKIKQVYAKDDIEFVCIKRAERNRACLDAAESAAQGSSHLVVLYGDMPMVTAESIEGMVRFHREQRATATVMTARVSDPTGYGRIIRQGDKVLDIREHKDATWEERTINEINAGFYCFDSSLVFSALSNVENKNRQEYYLTDVVRF